MKIISFLLPIALYAYGMPMAAQHFIFQENMGNPLISTSVSSYAGWQTNGGVQFSGSAELQNSQPSIGYNKASGTGNIFFAADIGKYFRIDQILTEPGQPLFLSFGIYKSTPSSSGADFSVEYSVNGADYIRIQLNLPTGSGTDAWSYQTFTLNATSSAHLYLRFAQQGALTHYRIDDVSIGTYIRLPVELQVFSGESSGSINRLFWVTSSESNNAGFQVERGLDGQQFELVGFVESLAPSGNSQSPLQYRFIDPYPIGDKQYYRLRQLDVNGRSSLSTVLLVRHEKPTDLLVATVFPNPSTGPITLRLQSPSNRSLFIRVMDLSGQVLQTHAVPALAGSNSIPLNLSTYTKGQYLISVGGKVVRVVRE
jgi:hypothetical protein